MCDDFKELLSIFNDQKVKYLIVGGYGVSFHAQADWRRRQVAADLPNRSALRRLPG